MKRLISVVSVLYLGCRLASGATHVWFMTDFNTDAGLLNFCGTLWDGSTLAHTGSVAWGMQGGAGTFGLTTNGPVAGVANDGFLQLTFASFDCSGTLGSFLCGAWLLDDFRSGQPYPGITFECDLRLGNGDPAPVGGFTVNFVRYNDPVLLALSAGDTVLQMNGQVSPNGGRFSDYGSASDLSLIEKGTTTGLSVGLQMEDNGNYHIPPDPGAVGTEAPGITHDSIGLHVRVDGMEIAVVPMPNGTTQQTYDQQGNPLPISDPTGTNAATDFRSVETGPWNGSGCDTNLLWVHFKTDLAENGLLNVWWKNFQLITNLPTGLAPYPGRFLLAGRVGSRAANIELDNVMISSTPTLPPIVNIVQTNGQAIITYTGTLQFSHSVTGGYQDYPFQINPLVVQLVSPPLPPPPPPPPPPATFFRSRW